MAPKKFSKNLIHDNEESLITGPIKAKKRKRTRKSKNLMENIIENITECPPPKVTKKTSGRKVYRKRSLLLNQKQKEFPHESASVEFISISLPKTRKKKRLNSCTKEVQTDINSDENLENVIKKQKFYENVETETIPIDTINEDINNETKIVALSYKSYNDIDSDFKNKESLTDKEDNTNLDIIEKNSSTTTESNDTLYFYPTNNNDSKRQIPTTDDIQTDLIDTINSDSSINEKQIVDVITVPNDYDKFIRNIENSHLVSVFGNTIKSTLIPEYNSYTFSFPNECATTSINNKNSTIEPHINIIHDNNVYIEDEIMDSETINIALPDIDTYMGAGDNPQNETLDSDDE